MDSANSASPARDGWARCVDHDYGISLSYPDTWSVADPGTLSQSASLLALASPKGAENDEAIIIASAIRVPSGMALDDVANFDARVQGSSPGFNQRGRTSGRHASGLMAVMLSFDLEWQTQLLRKEVLFLRASLHRVISITATCNYAHRRAHRETLRLILQSVRQNLPISQTGVEGGATILELRPDGPAQMLQLWWLFDATSLAIEKSIAEFSRPILHRGPDSTALFEIQAYLFTEIMVMMLCSNYSHTQPLADFLHSALTGVPLLQEPSQPLAIALSERVKLYIDAGRSLLSEDRDHVFAELLLERPKHGLPAEFDRAKLLDACKRHSEWQDAVRYSLTIARTFRLCMAKLFKTIPNLDKAHAADIERCWQSVLDGT